MERQVTYLVGGLAAAAVVGLASATWRRRRQARLLRLPFPPEWEAVLQRDVPLYQRLPPELQERLRGLVRVFLDGKRFEGCGGQEIRDDLRLIIAAQACLLVLSRPGRLYPGLRSILVYPGSFFVTDRAEMGSAVVEEEVERAGESWSQGAVVLAWEDVKASTAVPTDGHNVVLHEFAHQLDTENGAPDGVPLLRDRAAYAAWQAVLRREYRQLRRRVQRRDYTLMDEYGAEDPAEFFAVATETFFEEPTLMKAEHPALYQALKDYYALDPASWAQAAAAGEA